jgi:PPOX class probable FMN-dependent enzyme
MSHRLTAATLDDEATLRSLLGTPQPTTQAKIADRVNAKTRVFIERSPFVVIATCDDAGRCDVSPRGDPPGFVRILDDRTLLVPERPGNKLADSLRNILRTHRIGLLFVVPGVGETFRVNGRATLVTDAALLAPCAVEGKVPALGIVVDIEEAYTQCPKAFIRSQLWDPAHFVDRAELPSSGEILRAVVGDEIDAAEYDKARDERYRRREGLY